MDSLIETFHIDVKLLIAQIVNFGIVFGVLYFFALKPLVKIMQERSNSIEKSLDDAKKIDQRMKQTEEEYKAEIGRAKKDASAIIEKANLQAEARKSEMIAKAKEEIGQIINSEKEKIRSEKAAILKEIKGEVADLVAASMEKMLDEKGSDGVVKKMVSLK
jgi:F-type H+-transporting ATPase subunit b